MTRWDCLDWTRFLARLDLMHRLTQLVGHGGPLVGPSQHLYKNIYLHLSKNPRGCPGIYYLTPISDGTLYALREACCPTVCPPKARPYGGLTPPSPGPTPSAPTAEAVGAEVGKVPGGCAGHAPPPRTRGA